MGKIIGGIFIGAVLGFFGSKMIPNKGVKNEARVESNVNSTAPRR